MNKYGLALTSSVTQSLIPAMNKSGILYGFYPITGRVFNGTETTLALPDHSVPLTTVTLDPDPTMPSKVLQYMAAVWPFGMAAGAQPWASASLLSADTNMYHWYNMSSQQWLERFNKGIILNALVDGNMNPAAPSILAPAAPLATTPLALNWHTSVKYAVLAGNCNFFDFNWMTLFATQAGVEGLRIQVVTNPATTFKASILGIPTAQAGPANGAGTIVYDTIRILKLSDAAPGAYAFTFLVYDVNGLSTPVTLNLTVV